MEIPTDNDDSKAHDEMVLPEDEKSPTPNEPAEEEKPQELNENVEEETKLQEPSEEAGEDKSLGPNEEIENTETQGPNKPSEEGKPEEQHEQVEEGSNKVQDLNELSEDTIPEEINEQVEESVVQEFNEQGKDSKPQDLKEWAEEQMKILEEQHPGEEPVLPSVSNSDNITVTEWQEELLTSPIPEAKVDETPPKEAKASKSQDLKDQTEECMETSVGAYEKEKEKESSLYTSTQPRRKSKRQADGSSNTEPRKYSNISRNLRMPPRTPLLTQAGKPRMVDKAIQCNKLLMPRLPLPGTIPPPRSVTPRVKPPSTDSKTTQISPSFETLRRRTPPWVTRKKTEDNTIARISPSKITSPSLPQRSGNRYRKGVTPSTVSRPSSMTVKKEKNPNVTYNLYINVCDDRWKDLVPGLITGSCWEDYVISSGLARACTVFCNIKSGRIHVSKLRSALHALEVLVTSDEMYQTLKLVSVDEAGTLNFSEFLEAVNKTSPFAETDAFQNTLRAFRQMKNGTVAVDELKSVLTDLEVYMSSEEIQQTLDHTPLNKNKKVDLSEFLLAARDLQTKLEEEDFQTEYSTMERRPFQDVTELINAESRWRRRYCSCFDENISSSPSLFPLLALPSSDEDIALAQSQKTVSWKPNLPHSQTASSNVEGEGGDPEKSSNVEREGEDPGMKTSQSDITGQRRPSNVEGGEENRGITELPNSQSDTTEEKHERRDVIEEEKS